MIQLQFHSYPLQLRQQFTVAGCSRSMTPDVQLTLTADGITGYGEASMPPYLGETVESVMSFLSRVDLSGFSDPMQVDDILDYVDAIAPGCAPAKAAIDIALHDWVGRRLGQPLYRLWGLNPERTPWTTYTIGIDTPDVMQAKVRAVEGQFKRLKVKVGTADDRRNIEAIRRVTDLPLMVDANQGWTSREAALDQVQWLAQQGVILVEQPLPKQQLDDLAWLTERSPIPIVADESVQRLSDVVRLRGVVDGVNIKLMKCTGLREARKMITVARALGLKVMLGCMTETSCAVSAAAQLSPLADWADLDGHLLISNNPFRGGVGVEEGRLVLPDAPGVGVEAL
jgi:L-alanine-DL-glutamate epimerase-like enolase superfamily enzyme